MYITSAVVSWTEEGTNYSAIEMNGDMNEPQTLLFEENPLKVSYALSILSQGENHYKVSKTGSQPPTSSTHTVEDSQSILQLLSRDMRGKRKLKQLRENLEARFL